MTSLSNLDIAHLEFSEKRYSLSAQFAQYWLIQNAEDASGLILLAFSQFHLGLMNEAIAAFEEAALITPIGWDAQIALAVSYGSIGKADLSRDLLMEAAVSRELNDSQMLTIAAGLEAIDEPTLAMVACRQAGVLAPESAEAHYHMSYYASRCNYPASVIEALIRRAIDLEPDNLHYRVGLASLLIRLERREEALFIVKQRIPSQLKRITCKCCLKRIANLFFDFDDFAIARQCAQRLAELDVDHGSIQHVLGHGTSRQEVGETIE